MTPEETKRMHELCSRIAVEKDPHEFTRLVTELNDLLEQKASRIHDLPDSETEP